MGKTMQLIDPSTLVLGTNIRLAKLDVGFVASVEERGVLEPVLAHLDASGAVVVDSGQRRTLAAAQLQLPAIPVWVDDTPPEEQDRLVDQVVENEQREALTNRERAEAVAQLALLGVTPAQIAKRTGLPKDQVAAAARVASSPTALEHANDLDLSAAAIFAEFEGDEDATERLRQEAFRPGAHLEQVAQRIRDDREEEAAITSLRAELAEQGLVVDAPSYDARDPRPLSKLADGKGKKLNAGKHTTSCEGHVVWVEHQRPWDRSSPLVAMHGCRGWKAYGHVDLEHHGRTPAAEQSDEEREVERLKRRHVIESNKDWKAATTVRRRWLRDFASVKSAPSGAEQLIAYGINVNLLREVGPYWSGYELLDTKGDTIATEINNASAKRALQLALVLTIAAWEHGTVDDTWRRTYGHDLDVRVLTAISQWGHTLSEIEQRIIDGTAAEPT